MNKARTNNTTFSLCIAHFCFFFLSLPFQGGSPVRLSPACHFGDQNGGRIFIYVDVRVRENNERVHKRTGSKYPVSV